MNYSPVHYNLSEDGIWEGDGTLPPYLFTREIAVSVDVAYATRRPLLVSGPPGSGKSTLARAIAGIQRCSYLYHTVTSRSRLEDLTGDFDQLQRLHDTQSAAKNDADYLPDWAYQKPGLLWWAFEPDTARRRGGRMIVSDPRVKMPEIPGNLVYKKMPEAVLLLDEIDKAESNLPNDLLEPLDQRSFRRPDGKTVAAPRNLKLLVVITTNRERTLPAAFLRRCISLEIQKPAIEALVKIARHHFRGRAEDNGSLFTSVARKYQEIYEMAEKLDHRPPGTSEYLDAVQACLNLNVGPNSQIWEQIEKATLYKACGN
jgi:MoxR-like ATPase